MHGVSTRDVQSAGQPFLVIGKALATSVRGELKHALEGLSFALSCVRESLGPDGCTLGSEFKERQEKYIESGWGNQISKPFFPCVLMGHQKPLWKFHEVKRKPVRIDVLSIPDGLSLLLSEV